MILVSLSAFLGHWRRQPMQLLALILGLAVATALWSGVEAVNSEAKASYNRAAGFLGGDKLARIERKNGPLLDADFASLRRAGWLVSPVLEGRLRLGDQRFRVIGIDPLTIPSGEFGNAVATDAGMLGKFSDPPYQLHASADTAKNLPREGLPPVEIRDLPSGLILADISVAKHLLQKPNQISRIIVAERQKPSRVPLKEIDKDFILRPPDGQSDMGSLTESFHLNLTAFGLMAFVVGLFIVHATISLAFEQRRALLRTLRALGTPLKTLILALLLELLLLSSIAGLIGVSLGYLVAASLLPDVSASLEGLYGASVSGTLSLPPIWWLGGLSMGIFGALAAAASNFWKLAHMPILEPANARAWLAATQARIRLQTIFGLICFACSAILFLFASGLLVGFAIMGGVLIGAALLLPTILSATIQFFARRSKGVIEEWFWADTRMQLNGLSLALMALLLALSINIGVGAMVGGFRTTFLSWLDQRLFAQLYVYGDTDAQTEALMAALQARTDVDAVLPIWSEQVTYQRWPVNLYGFADNELYHSKWPMLSISENAWETVATGTGILISEQFSRRFDLNPGDKVVLSGWELRVSGVYSDYGNTIGAAMVNIEHFLTHFPNVEKRRIGVHSRTGDIAAISRDITDKFDLRASQIINQEQLKSFSRNVFEKTFSVTAALNSLTLGVAGLALFTSLLTLAQIRLPQLAPLWAMGLTRDRLGRLELLRSLLLALFTALLAIPLGVTFAWILTDVINVAAFGWKLPLYHFPRQWLILTMLALLVAGLSALLPVLKLRNMSAAKLLRVFSDER